MAKLSVTLPDPTVIEAYDINLEEPTFRDFIMGLINAGLIIPETELPLRECRPIHGYYGIIDKNNLKRNTQNHSNESLSSLGFVEGDCIRITAVGCCA